ncbi:MAG: hypothetical protein ACLQMF_18690 [Rectinemataceae bacterium]
MSIDPETHNLPFLLDLAAEPVPSLASLDQLALDLNAFSVVVRYPSHVVLEEADAKDALGAVEDTKWSCYADSDVY